jgi:hypothetical protein
MGTVHGNMETHERDAVRRVLARGDGVLTGGATGVDFFAMHEALRIDPSGKTLVVIIPAYLEDYIKDYYEHWVQKPVTVDDVDRLIEVLRRIKGTNPSAIRELPYTDITSEHYYLRNSEEVESADEVFAFQVNQSPGTQDTIDKAKETGVPVSLHKKYLIDERSIPQ